VFGEPDERLDEQAALHRAGLEAQIAEARREPRSPKPAASWSA